MADLLKVAIFDDHPLYRSGVAQTLIETGEFQIVAQGGSAEEAISCAASEKPDLILLDISMPGSGIEAVRVIARRDPTSRLVMLTASDAQDDVLKALAAGASGYLVKGVSSGDFLSALRSIAAGETYVSPGIAARMLIAMRSPAQSAPSSGFETLQPREEQILKLVASGLSNKEVARKLDLQEKTIKHYMTSILQKLQVRNRVEAAMKAREEWG